MKLIIFLLSTVAFVAFVIAGCRTQQPENHTVSGEDLLLAQGIPGRENSNVHEAFEFRLQTALLLGRMVFIGVGGGIDGVVNPDLVVPAGKPVRLVVINGDGIPHDLLIPDLGAKTPLLVGKGNTAELSFITTEAQKGTYVYFCSVSGHRQAGMEGNLEIVAPEGPEGAPEREVAGNKLS